MTVLTDLRFGSGAKRGFSPVSLAWCMLVEEAFLAIVVKSYLVVKIADYKWMDVWDVYWSCFKVLFVSIPIPIMVCFLLDCYSINVYVCFFVKFFSAIFFVSVAVWFWGLDLEVKDFVKQFLKKIRRHKCL